MINLQDLFYGKLHWCCGQPEQVLEAIYEVLVEARDYHEKELWKLNTETSCYASGYHQFMWHALNDSGLLEHGCGVGGSWVSEEGYELIKMIEELGIKGVCDKVRSL